MDILWLGEPSCGDVALAGGKAASLSRLADRHRVPPGFCISTSAYARWVASGPDGDCEAPADLVGGVTAAYQELAVRCGRADPPVAVRSSATDEDGAGASFAGQYETILNVSGVQAVVEAILRCWTAASSTRVANYRCRQGLSSKGVRLPVLVQHLVGAEIAVVAFSANPVTGDRGEIIINANWGLGESLVSGSVTPDAYVVRRTDGAVIQRTIARKQRMTVPVDGGTREVETPQRLQDLPTLDDRLVSEVAQLAIMLEATVGTPVDVEAAYEHGELYLLQCRPITALH